MHTPQATQLTTLLLRSPIIRY